MIGLAEDLAGELQLTREIHPRREGVTVTRNPTFTVVVIHSGDGLLILIWW